MEIEQELTKLGNKYRKVEATSWLVSHGKADLFEKLDKRKRPFWHFGLFTSVAYLSFLFIFMLGSVVAASYSAHPGDKLYPVKVLTDDFYFSAKGQPELNTDRRVEDVLSTSILKKEDRDEATKQYEKSLQEEKNKLQEQGRQEELRQSLKRREEQLRKFAEENPSSSEQIERALDATRRAAGEVQGIKDSFHNNPVNWQNRFKKN